MSDSQGPSGSGKTTLLNVLGGRALAGVTGDILMNNKPLSKGMKRIIAYVLQEDIFYMHLTVREQLTFTAQLRLPETMSDAQRTAQIEEVMQKLNIVKCQNTPIMLVSGGEKKRVNIGTELLTNPSVILLDEPTSGLDSTTAAALVATLQELAQSGKTVISSIHQPSSHVFYSFDKLFVLADGHMVYNGSPRGCMPYLQSRGYAPPGDYNPADFLMDLVTSYDMFSEKYEVAPRQALIEAWDNAATLKEAEVAQAALAAAPSLADPDSSLKQRPTSYMTQLKVLLQRSQKNASSQLFTKLNFVQCIGVSIITGLMWFQMDNDETTIQDRSGFIFFFMTYWMMNACFSGMMAFPPERLILLKERASGSYQLSAFFLAKTLSEAPLRLLLPSIYIVISYWMAGLNPSAGSFFGAAGTELLMALTGESIGLFIGTSFMDLEKAMVVCSLSMLLLMLVGGFFVDGIPYWLEWLKYLSVFKYGYHACLQFEFPDDRSVDCDGGSFLPRCGKGADSVDGSYITDLLNVQGSVGFNIGIIVVMLVVFRVAAYCCLRFMKHNQGTRM